jgi:hypothetical protein
MSLPFLERLAARDRRAVLLGLAILLPAFAWVGIVRPYRAALTDVRERVAAEQALLTREEELLRNADRLPEQMGKAEAEADRAQHRLVDAANTALAEAELTDHLERIADRSRVLLLEIQSVARDRRAEPGPSGVQPIRLAVHGESDLAGIADFLHRLEQSQMLLRIEQLQLEPVMERPSRSRRSQDDDDESTSARPTGVMDFAIIVEAYAPPDTPGGPSMSSPEVMQ